MDGGYMKLKNVLLTLTLTLGASAFAAEQWTVTELKLAQDSALAKFSSDGGNTAAISGLAVKKNIQGTAGKVVITTKVDGASSDTEYFCHYHEADEIDCH